MGPGVGRPRGKLVHQTAASPACADNEERAAEPPSRDSQQALKNSKTLRFCCRHVATTLSIRSTRRLPALLTDGGLTWMFNDDTYPSYHLTAGDFGDGTAKNGAESNAGQIYAHAIVFKHKFCCRWPYVLENTLGSNTGLGAKNNQ